MKTRYYLDLKDILCFEFECHNCNNRRTYTYQENTRFPAGCPSCGTEWIFPDPNSISHLIGAVTQAKKALAACNFNVAVEISAPPKEKPRATEV